MQTSNEHDKIIYNANLKKLFSSYEDDSPIAQTVSSLLEYAIDSEATDIHIEPREDFTQIRYRIHGKLKEIDRLPRGAMKALVSRIKTLANLKINEHRIPQDGYLKLNVSEKQFTLRVSTIPIADGEKIVMHVLSESNQSATLSQLGCWGQALETIAKSATQPNGMVLLAGPTGSGKSTTLFSILSSLNNPDVNIATIEDPIEYKIPGVNQTQINQKVGMTFASGLRAILRQDPNIIMVGEMRDKETMQLGIQSALTGRLLFSTLHSDNASTCLAHLSNTGVEPFLLANTLRSVISQKLTRKLCQNCRQKYTPNQQEINKIIKLFNLSKDQDFSYIHNLEKQAANQQVGVDVPLSTDKSTILSLWTHNPEGCSKCRHTGFKGRIGIFESLSVSPSIQKLIIANATSEQIQSQAIKEGFVTMRTDGLIKVLRGETTINEVLYATHSALM